MLFERRCPICSRPAPGVCATCWAGLDPAPVRRLADHDDDHDADPAALEVRSLFAYSERVAALVLTAKNGGGRHLLRQLGRCLGAVAADGQPFDLVTWVPANAANRRRRGFDQGRLLARSVAAELCIPARRLLVRDDDRGNLSHQGQMGKGRDDRLRGAPLRAVRPVGGRVLLVDDVVTTGTSLRHGAQALLAAGAHTVTALAIASSDRRRAAVSPDLRL